MNSVAMRRRPMTTGAHVDELQHPVLLGGDG